MVQEEQFKPSLDTKPFGTPLRRFQGLLKDYESEKRTDPNSGRTFMVIQFNFVDLVVLESVEPYPFPIATLGIGYSTSENTRWDALAGSIKRLWGSTPALDELVNKVQEWAYLPCKLRTKLESGEWVDQPSEAWQVAGVTGIGAGVGASVGSTPVATAGPDPTEHLLDLLDGKLEADFHQVLFQDPVLREHPDLITSATERKLLPALELAGRCYRGSDGVWHKGANPNASAVAEAPTAPSA